MGIPDLRGKHLLPINPAFSLKKEPMRQLIESLVTIVALVAVAEVVNRIVGYRMVTIDIDKMFK